MYPISFLFGLNKFKNGGWYEPSLDDRIEWILHLLDLKPGDRAIDIGSGDGRIVIAMAKKGAKATGIEFDLKLVKQSQQNILKAKLQNKATILAEDMWSHSYKPYNKVVLYQFKTVMGRFEEKLQAELPKGALVVSNFWPFPHWKLEKQIEDVYLYKKQ